MGDRTDTAGPGGFRSEERLPGWTRPFVWTFLAAFAACGLLGLEAWPLTGWRLFADLRADHQVAYRAVVIDEAGNERPLPFARLPLSHRGAVQVLHGFPELSVAERREVCEAWAGAVRDLGVPVGGIRVYRVEWDLSRREAGRALPPSERSPAFSCLEPGREAFP